MDHEGSDFRRLAEAAPVPALLVGPLGRVIWKNHAAKSIVPNGTLLHALHLDDKPSAGYVLERLIGIGATRADVGQAPDAPFVVLADPEVAGVRIGGNFRWSNLDGFVGLLEQGFPVRAERHPDRIVLHSR